MRWLIIATDGNIWQIATRGGDMTTSGALSFKEACNAFVADRKNQFGKIPPLVSQKLIERQIAKQTRWHRHKGYATDVRITTGVSLKGFQVNAGVMRPEIMTSVFLARYMFFENGQYRDGRVLDMGCGSGIIGIVMALNCAKSVVFSDVSNEALENTRANANIFGIKDKSKIVLSDLFENIRGKFNLIEFNHPFFSDLRLRSEAINSTMIQPATLIHRFFEGAKKHLLPGGKIIMPYYHLAGVANDPGTQAPKHGYRIVSEFRMIAKAGLQKGAISIYVIVPETGKN